MNYSQDFKEIVFKKDKPIKKTCPKIEVNKVIKQLLDDDDTTEPLKTFGKENGKILQNARTANKLTQEQVGNQINERKNIVNLYETGNVVPDNRIVNKFRKLFNVKI
jgi:ribosome-binding protein aMBF1 (putative translation factor)